MKFNNLNEAIEYILKNENNLINETIEVSAKDTQLKIKINELNQDEIKFNNINFIDFLKLLINENYGELP
jgi:hypothetical protein